MSIEKKNFEALQQRYPEIYEKVRNIKVNQRFKLTPAGGRANTPNLKDSASNMFFYDNRDPMKAAVDFVVSKQIKVPFFNLFLGAGLMYNFFAYFKAYKVQNSVNIIIEKDPEIFRNLISCVDITKVVANDMFHIFVDEEPTVLFTKINKVIHGSNAKFHAKSVNIIEDAGSFAVHKDYYINSIRILKDALREVIMFYGNDPFDSMVGIENTFLNIEEILNYPGIMDLQGKFKGKPGIVVSTGPSLVKNIHLLKGLENKAVICAADASVKVMQKHGLKPHLVSSLERMTPTAKLFEDLTEEDVKDVYFAGTPVVHPLTYKNFPGERIITYRDFATFQWIDIKKGILGIGPSAGNMAFKILEYMGCSPIILIGQDLAFGPDEETHAEGTTYGAKQDAQVFKDIRQVEGNYQPVIKTTRVWEMFLQFYHRDASGSPARVINATEGGAKILGTEIMTFQEAIDQCIADDINVLDVIKASLNKPTPEQVEADRTKVLGIVENGLEYCGRAQDIFSEAITKCDEYIEKVMVPYKATGEYDAKQGSVYLSQLEQMSKVFQDKQFYEVLMHYVQSYFIKTMIEINAHRSSAKSLAEAETGNVLLLKNMFTVMIGLNGKMIQLMQVLRQKLIDGAEKKD